MILAGFLDLLGAGIALRSLLGGGLVLVEVHCLFGANGHIVLLDKVQDLEGMTKRPEPAEHLSGSSQVDAYEALAEAPHMQGVVSEGLLVPQSMEVVNGQVFELFQVRVFLGLGRKATDTVHDKPIQVLVLRQGLEQRIVYNEVVFGLVHA